MRVLMTADTVGGVWTYACELIRGLAACGVDVTLATMGELPSPTQLDDICALGNVELMSSHHALEWMPDPWRDVDAAGEWLLQLADLVQPDIVHINGYAHAALPFKAPVVCVAHSCVLTWHRAVRGSEAGLEWNEYRCRTKAGLEAADAIVGPTQTIVDDVLAAHHVARPGRVIHNGRDGARWTPAPKESLVLAAGRLWDEAKGLATLAAAAHDVALPIAVAGPTQMPGGDQVQRPDGVRMLGNLPPKVLALWMARARIYALPARYEPFGLSILEAALAGCALVLGDIPSLREVWGDTAVYADPTDPRHVADAINKVSRNTRDLATASRARALALTPMRMAGAYNALYRELATASREARAS